MNETENGWINDRGRTDAWIREWEKEWMIE